MGLGQVDGKWQVCCSRHVVTFGPDRGASRHEGALAGNHYAVHRRQTRAAEPGPRPAFASTPSSSALRVDPRGIWCGPSRGT